MSLIQLNGICRYYGTKERRTTVLRDLDLQINEGDMLAIRGKSGSGKTTLLNILGGIDFQSDGSYLFQEEKLVIRNQSEGARFRRRHVGIVVQHFALLDDLSAYDNIALALWSDKLSSTEIRRRVNCMLEELGIMPLKHLTPLELSGGEKQRVAIGRALIRNPDILLCDEPTGALDEETEKQILSLFRQMHADGKTLVIVTHDDSVAATCSRQVHIRDGQIADPM